MKICQPISGLDTASSPSRASFLLSVAPFLPASTPVDFHRRGFLRRLFFNEASQALDFSANVPHT
jgi:hypothetical protein